MHSPLFGTSLRQPPSNMQAEQALLGALLANNKAYDRVAEFLAPDHFADAVHGRIYEAIARRIERGQVADTLTLKAELEHAGELEAVGGTNYLAELLTAMVGVIHAGEYGRAVHDAWLRRQLIDLSMEVVETAFVPPEGGGPAVMELLESRLLHISEGFGEVRRNVGFGDAVQSALDKMREVEARGDGLAGITTGYAALDRVMHGFMPGDMYILAARPAVGKTGLGLGIAARSAAAGNPTLMWSGEMSALQLGQRAAAAYANLSTSSVFTARGWDTPEEAEGAKPRPLHAYEWSDLRDAAEAAGRLPLEIYDQEKITVAQLRARARRMKRSRTGLRLVVVDYLGLMAGSEAVRRHGRYEEVTEISRDLKALARELDVPVLALHQLNRANESREDKRPTLADLRDSGAIEQDAAVVMMLHREHYYLKQQKAPARAAKESEEQYANRVSLLHERTEFAKGKAELLIPKNRHGPARPVELRFTDHTTWFRDTHEDELSPAWGKPLGG